MRAVALPADPVYKMLDDFVLGFKDIRREHYVGRSHGYSSRQKAVGTTNGAGPRNVQIFVLAPDSVVMHALPGFWHPEDLAHELRFSKSLYKLWRDKKRNLVQKRKMFSRLQELEPRSHSPATYARSQWQNFDQFTEMARLRGRTGRDTFQRAKSGHYLADERGRLMMKPTNVLVHERMARQPFVRFEDFDIEALIDYGQKYYDNNARHDRSRHNFPKPRPAPRKKKSRGRTRVRS